MKKYWIVCCLALAPCAPAQTVSISAVTNTASPATAVSPGSLVSIFGDFPGFERGTSVKSGGVDAPILFSSRERIDVQIPYGATPGLVTLETQVAGGANASAQVMIEPYAPVVLTVGGKGALEVS